MKKKISIVSSMLVLISVLIFTECKKSVSFKDSDCEIVYQGESYLKVVNELGDKIQVYFGGYGAELNPMTCERYGCISGSRWVDLTNLSTQKKRTIDYTVAKGETYTLTVTADFFSK